MISDKICRWQSNSAILKLNEIQMFRHTKITVYIMNMLLITMIRGKKQQHQQIKVNKTFFCDSNFVMQIVEYIKLKQSPVDIKQYNNLSRIHILSNIFLTDIV